MISRNNKNHSLAWQYFYPEGRGRAKKGYVLHHIDSTLIDTDIERYNSWNPSDLVMITTEEHSTLHATGKISSDEKKRKISESMSGEKNHFYGRHHSEETKQKMREAKRRNQAFLF